MVEYLKTPIVAARQTVVPRYGVTRAGYSKRSGAPTSYEIRLQGEKRWRRVMVWAFSNTGTLFVRVNGRPLVTDHWAIEAAERAKPFREKASAWFSSRERDRRHAKKKRPRKTSHRRAARY